MDEARQAAYADEVARSAPLGGRGGLGLETGGVAPEKRKVSKAEKELLGSLKGHPGGLASMQTTVARAITHGNANFDPYGAPSGETSRRLCASDVAVRRDFGRRLASSARG